MSDVVTPGLRREGDRVVCAACGTDIAAASDGFKSGAVRREVKLADVGAAYDTGFSDDVVLRHFYCPGCAALLDTETSRVGEPVLDDRIAG